MAKGKNTCKILKEIRRQIAEANDIEFVTSECRYKGDCLGTCPKCEAEVRYLEQQLHKRQLAGKLVNLAGISGGALSILTPIAMQSQTANTSFPTDNVTVNVSADTIIANGVVLYNETMRDGSISREPLEGAIIINTRTGKGTSTDIDGNFNIKVCKGDSLEISLIGFITQSIYVADSTPLEICLNSDGSINWDDMALVGAIGPQKEQLKTKASVNGSPKKIKVKKPKRKPKKKHKK